MIKKLVILLFLFIGISFSQTTEWTLSWDPNIEPDINYYTVHRDTVAVAIIPIANVPHPTVEYVDSDIVRGQQYFYRLTASDLSLNQSGYSNEVSAAIPDILETDFTYETQSINTEYFATLFNDPDNSFNEMNVISSGESNVNVTVFSDHISIEPSPSTFVGTATFSLRVEDDKVFFDQRTITVHFESSAPATPTNLIITR